MRWLSHRNQALFMPMIGVIKETKEIHFLWTNGTTHLLAHSCCVGVSYLSLLKACLSAGGCQSCVRCNTNGEEAEKNKSIIREVCLTRVRLCSSCPETRLLRLRQIPSCWQTLLRLSLGRIQVEASGFKLSLCKRDPNILTLSVFPSVVLVFLDGPAWPKTALLLSPENSSDGTKVGMMDEWRDDLSINLPSSVPRFSGGNVTDGLVTVVDFRRCSVQYRLLSQAAQGSLLSLCVVELRQVCTWVCFRCAETK